MKIYIDLDGEKVVNWATSPLTKDSFEVDIDVNHELLRDARGFVYRNGELSRTKKCFNLKGLKLQKKKRKTN